MLSAAALVATLVVVVLHVIFMVLETFLWTTPRGRRIFGQTREQAEEYAREHGLDYVVQEPHSRAPNIAPAAMARISPPTGARPGPTEA